MRTPRSCPPSAFGLHRPASRRCSIARTPWRWADFQDEELPDPLAANSAVLPSEARHTDYLDLSAPLLEDSPALLSEARRADYLNVELPLPLLQ